MAEEQIFEGKVVVGDDEVVCATLTATSTALTTSRPRSFTLEQDDGSCLYVDLSELELVRGPAETQRATWRSLRDTEEARLFDASSIAFLERTPTASLQQVELRVYRIANGSRVKLRAELTGAHTSMPATGDYRTKPERAREVRAKDIATDNRRLPRRGPSLATRVREAALTRLREAIPWPDIYPFGIIGFFALGLPSLLLSIYMPRGGALNGRLFCFMGGLVGIVVIGALRARKKRQRESETESAGRREYRAKSIGCLLAWLPALLLLYSVPFYWWASSPEAHDGSVRVDGDELGSWTTEPGPWAWILGQSLTCAHPTTSFGGGTYDSVLVKQGAHRVWVGPDRVTVQVTAATGKTPRTVHLSPESCSRYETGLEQAGSWFGVFGDRQNAATGEVHLSCKLPSGGTLEADLDLGTCDDDRTLQPPPPPDEPAPPDEPEAPWSSPSAK